MPGVQGKDEEAEEAEGESSQDEDADDGDDDSHDEDEEGDGIDVKDDEGDKTKKDQAAVAQATKIHRIIVASILPQLHKTLTKKVCLFSCR